MGYKMTGKFLLCYLKLLSFSDFPQSTLFLNRKNIPCLPVVRKAKDDQSEYIAEQIWEGEDKMGIKACYARQRKKTRPPCRWLAGKHAASHTLVPLSALIECHVAFYSISTLMR